MYGGLRFFERAEVKHALAYLQLIENPRNDAAFGRVVNFPTRGIGARSLELLQDAARQYNVSLAEAVAYVPGKAGSSMGAFIRLIDQMRAETRRMTLPRDGGIRDQHQRPDPALPGPRRKARTASRTCRNW